MKVAKLYGGILKQFRIVRSYSFWHPDDDVKMVIQSSGVECERDDFTGFGTLHTERGDKYEGDFLVGKKHGTGTWYYYNDDGEWENDVREGKGRLDTHNEETYIGDFVEDGILGEGFVEYVRDGERYEGNFEDGKEHGEGKMYYENGDIYKGNFKFGRRHGDGVYIFGDSSIEFSGKFKWNKMYHGKLTFLSSGVVYEGDFCEDTGNPTSGKLVLPSGHTFESDTFSAEFMPIGENVKSIDTEGNVEYVSFSDESEEMKESDDDL